VPGRIITMQRQVRELGRLRTGYYQGRPIRSKTWIITSPQRECLDAAAELWGGQVEKWTPHNSRIEEWRLVTATDSLDALLPPGDPLTQNNEMWNRGGCVRRCDGETESKSAKPCLCLAQFGEDFFRLGPDQVCKPYSQLNLILPQLPDLGVWRHVTKSYYAAGEIAGMVDMIKRAVGDPNLVVPVRLRIDQRSKVADGKTTPYPVPVIEIRGASAGQILAGNVPTLAVTDGAARKALGGSTADEQPAIGSGPAEEEDGPEKPGEPLTVDRVLRIARLMKDPDEVLKLGQRAKKQGLPEDEWKPQLIARIRALSPKEPVAAAAEPAEPIAEPAAADALAEGELEPDPDEVWMAIQAVAGKQKWSADDLEKRVLARFNKPSDEINGFEMAAFLDELKNGAIK
jgi:hypothetical protein